MNTINSHILKCIIVDDELSSQKVLQHFIANDARIKLVSISMNSKEAFEDLNAHSNIDLIFLDINMPHETGIEFYQRLARPPQVIFTTAYAEYAVKGFDLNATDYLLKPISSERFTKAVDKAIDRIDHPDPEFLMLNENKVLHKVHFDQIIFAEASGDYVKVQTKEKQITTPGTFTNFINRVPSSFLRLHKSFIVNTLFIENIRGNQLKALEYTLPIGQKFKEKVRAYLNIE